jgi:serine protease Do
MHRSAQSARALLLAACLLAGPPAGHALAADTPDAPPAQTKPLPPLGRETGAREPEPRELGEVQGSHGTLGRPVNPDAGPGKINRVTIPDFADLVAQVRPAVVSISATLRPGAGGGDDEGEGGQGRGGGGGRGGPARVGGSGFLTDADGTIVTNNHVVENTTGINVTLDDGTVLPARIIGRDARTDLAVIRVNAGHPLPFLQLGDSSATRVGEWVIAMGAPYGLGGTVTAGIISAEGRDIGSGQYDEYIQIDAAINHGNSGGPTFAQDGRVIGVNTAIFSPTRGGGSIGIGFAIPANLVKIVVAQLQKTGHVVRGFVGIDAQTVSVEMARALGLAQHAGALVAQVTPDSPAAKAGLLPGDVIRALNGTPVANPRELAISVLAIPPGGMAKLDVIRAGETRTIEVRVGEAPSERPTEPSTATGPTTAAGPHVGITLSAITPEQRARLNLGPDVHGVAITKVDPGSPADTAGIKPGDVIVGVGARAIETPADAIAAIRAAARDHAVALRILRDGTTRFVAIPLDTGNG